MKHYFMSVLLPHTCIVPDLSLSAVTSPTPDIQVEHFYHTPRHRSRLRGILALWRHQSQLAKSTVPATGGRRLGSGHGSIGIGGRGIALSLLRHERRVEINVA